MQRQTILIFSLWALLFSFFLSGCSSKVLPTPTMAVNAVALDGYDVVAYRSYHRAIKADDTYAYTYDGLDWYFDSAENRDRFKNAPEFFLPVFGGYCANAMAEEDVEESNPEYWYLFNDQLFLFEDEDAKAEWFRGLSNKLVSAQTFWTSLHQVTTSEDDNSSAE